MFRKLVIYSSGIALSISTGSVSALLTSKNMDIYSAINYPPLSPPSILFPIVWTILYILMGISSARIYIADKFRLNKALTVYLIQLAVNFVWSLIFFNERDFLFSFIWLILLWILIVLMIKLFSEYDLISALLQIPYLLWVTFAGYLNLAIYLLNK